MHCRRQFEGAIKLALLIPDRIFSANGLRVKEYLLTNHNPNQISLPGKRALPLIGITVHNTNDINEARQTTDPEQYVRATINDNMGTVRVHYYVDDDEAWHMLPDDWQSWHAGQSGKADRNGSAAGNAQTISIECIMDGSGSDKDRRAEDNCAKLIAYLMEKYGMNTADNLFTHNYWCNVRNGRNGTIDALNKLNDGYKNCPVYIRPHWDSFVDKINSYMRKEEKPVAKSKYYVQVGAFSSKENAEKYLADVKKDYPNAFIKVIE